MKTESHSLTYKSPNLPINGNTFFRHILAKLGILGEHFSGSSTLNNSFSGSEKGKIGDLSGFKCFRLATLNASNI